MLIANNLNDFFNQITLVFVDSQIKSTKQIQTDKAIFFVDDLNNVESINILDSAAFKLSNDKKFYSLNNEQTKLILDAANELNLNLNSEPKFVYAKVLERIVHPKSEKLFVLKLLIDPLNNTQIQVVTNTLDSQEGKVLVVALPGSTVFSGLKILKGKMMDVESNGMLTGYQTLGKTGEGLIFGDENQIGKEFNL
ncbi:TyrS-associated PheT N-terminal domain-related protein TapR [Mycoplasmopsis gallopavonis]|uniref:Phenylalanyl-tRNA synthetase subunit beta n=1 Tax=Mycoplasmopsis gallopavonis TaxID=76629 RepID=A0A449AYK4_9BACT|nr:hypothetical protein [Mycoplasmopsis gallopavonis]RIV16740.1 hypothetical protein D1113_01155 [Mycoplasmopsis gallopavonis]VEU72572.1 phenylalanyl-tRNA synthetase subunit beta [Mycoplasmopsis gallopavonis]